MSGVYGPELERGDHRLVIGVPGSGKTYYAVRLVAKARRVIYFDPAGEFEGVRGAIVCDVDTWPSSEVTQQSHFRVVVRAEQSGERDVGDEFVYTAQRARAIGDCVLLADEVGDYNRGPAERALKMMHRNGHKQGVVTVFVSQRAVDIPLGCRATATHVASFLQDNEQDIDALRDVYDPGSPGFSERVRRWKPYQPPVTWERKKLYR